MSRIHREHTLTGMVNFGRYAVPFAGSPAVLGSDDVLVVNAGIHFSSHDEHCLGVAQIASFGADLVADPVAPRIIYLATPSQHFETEDGTFNGLGTTARCITALSQHDPRQAIERAFMLPNRTCDGYMDAVDYEKLGSFHVGEMKTKGQGRGKYDCSHYCQVRGAFLGTACALFHYFRP